MSKIHVIPRPRFEDIEADISAGRYQLTYEKLSAFRADIDRTLARMGEHDIAAFVDESATKH